VQFLFLLVIESCIEVCLEFPLLLFEIYMAHILLHHINYFYAIKLEEKKNRSTNQRIACKAKLRVHIKVYWPENDVKGLQIARSAKSPFHQSLQPGAFGLREEAIGFALGHTRQ
jgi:hypothetical protein